MKTKPQKKLPRELATAIQEYVAAWKRQDWSGMSLQSSIAWQKSVGLPCRSLQAMYEHIRLDMYSFDLRNAIVPKGHDETGAFYEVPVNVKFQLASWPEPQWRKLRFNVIQEDASGRPVKEGGLWRVQPISTLRGMAA